MSYRVTVSALAMLLSTVACGDSKPQEVDRSCVVDSDCVAKNFATCCGARPTCVNAGFEPETPDLECGPYIPPCSAVLPFECRCTQSTCEDVPIQQ